ncbi:branched-chain amino acid ABC transporter substrate-binding protein [Legionella gratiana]|uniref:Branched-chain amino acid ABC transporter substrate-binding protein n=1 Tax=Legionella gratiana TaxID=45066 RepID=A0A378J6W8_9GAMM|nr:hypothetical protein [Legionella gratiana]KTD06016.1 branched-chain amino acid ABC transporter substrate-binding protein [Legionella gratiana]STX42657.1 branched-chain amino acid ABC transporter substrate-binding protein [Legionella gratiana]
MKHCLSTFMVLSAFFIFLMTGFDVAASDSTDTAKRMTINVGIYAPFSHESAFIGRNMLGAMEIARDQLKSSNVTYEFYTLDKMSNNAKATKTLQKFIDAHHINVLLTEGTASGALVAPLAKRNNIIHFCLTNDSVITDGKNNFLAQGAHHQNSTALTQTTKPEFIAQFQQEYFSHPITQAGYAYDIFHIIHNSAVLAMKTNADFSSQAVATHLLALKPGVGVMGTFNVDKQGVSYKKPVLTA